MVLFWCWYLIEQWLPWDTQWCAEWMENKSPAGLFFWTKLKLLLLLPKRLLVLPGALTNVTATAIFFIYNYRCIKCYGANTTAKTNPLTFTLLLYYYCKYYFHFNKYCWFYALELQLQTYNYNYFNSLKHFKWYICTMNK